MKTLKKIDPGTALYLIGLVLAVFIVAALCFFTIMILALCAMDDPYIYSSCGTQPLAISGSLVIFTIAACIAALKHPFASGVGLLVVGGILLVAIFSLTAGSYYLALVVLLFIDGLLFLSMGSFRQNYRN